MIIENEFEIGQPVYLKTDKEQLQRIVTGMIIRHGTILYHLSQGTGETVHYGVEICAERDVILATTG